MMCIVILYDNFSSAKVMTQFDARVGKNDTRATVKLVKYFNGMIHPAKFSEKY